MKRRTEKKRAAKQLRAWRRAHRRALDHHQRLWTIAAVMNRINDSLVTVLWRSAAYVSRAEVEAAIAVGAP